MKDYPIIFTGDMVRAILDGRKTMTRRIVKWTPREAGLDLQFSGLEAGHYNVCNPASGWVLRSRRGDGCWTDRTHPLHGPYVVGRKLWVRETWQPIWATEEPPLDGLKSPEGWNIGYVATDGRQEWIDLRTEDVVDRCFPSIHMPRWASRITLEVTDCRVEQVQDITEEDARAEGARREALRGFGLDPAGHTHRMGFINLWNSLNAAKGYGWDANVWVWVVTFERAT